MQINSATAADIDDLARIHVEGWRSSYAGLAPQDYLDGLKVEDLAADWTKWLAAGEMDVRIARDDSGAAAGFISTGKMKTPVPGMSPIRPVYTGEIYAIYILPEYWRQGLGRRLMAAGVADLQARKHKALCLWTADGNKRAQGFYKALGGQKLGSKKIEVGGRSITDVVFGWRDLKPFASASLPLSDSNP